MIHIIRIRPKLLLPRCSPATMYTLLYIMYIGSIRLGFGIHHGLPEQPPVVRCINDITMRVRIYIYIRTYYIICIYNGNDIVYITHDWVGIRITHARDSRGQSSSAEHYGREKTLFLLTHDAYHPVSLVNG